MKRLPIIALVCALLAATASFVIAETVASSRVAATGATCQSGSVYLLGSGGNIYQIDTSTGARTHLGAYPATGFNAFGITSDGAHAYSMVSAGSGASTVYEFNTDDATSAHFAGPIVSGSYSFVMGALNPATGIFYMATYGSTGIDLYGFDTATNTAISGRISQVALPAGGSGGDMVFDSSGHLYVVSGGSVNGLLRVNQPIPTTGTNGQLTASKLATVTVASPNGVTFDGDGYLYVSSSSQLSKVNPNTGAQVSVVAIGAASPSDSTVDLADCQYNGQLQLQANVAGRYAVGDQFGLTITGGGVASGNNATTAGTTIGQLTDDADTAGPIAALGGTVYQIHETAAGTGTLANYTLAASCVDTANGNAPVTLTPLAPGSTSEYSLTFPNATGSQAVVVDCTFTDTPATPPTISLTKVLAAARHSSTDQFTVAIHTGSPSGPVVNSTAHSTTAGTGGTVAAGSGTTGAFAAASATAYYLTEAATGSTSLSDYLATISCTDAAGLQTGLPSGVAFAGSLAITPVNGAQIACVISNGVQSYTVAQTASAVTARPGDTITYTAVAKNIGRAPLTSAAFTDGLADLLDDGTLIAGSVSASAGNANVTSGKLTWSGPLALTPAPGSSAVITFSIRLNDPLTGNHVLHNAVTPTGPGAVPPADPDGGAPAAIKAFTVTPTITATGIGSGNVAALSFTTTNSGTHSFTADDPATFSVALAGALAGAQIDTDGTPGATSDGNQLNWTGPLAAGASVEISFTLILGAGDGDPRLLAVVATGAGSGGGCAGTSSTITCAAPTMFVTGAVAAEMIEAAGLADTGTDSQSVLVIGGVALIIGVQLQLLASALGERRRRRPVQP